MSTPLLKLLYTGGLLSRIQADELFTQMQAQSVSALTVVIASGVIASGTLADYLATQLNIRQIQIDHYPFCQLCQQLKISDLVLTSQALPLEIHDQYLTIATGDPTIPQLREDFQFRTGLHIELTICDANALWSGLQKIRSQQTQQFHAAERRLELQINEDQNSYDRQQSPQDTTPVSQYIHQILLEAKDQKASDIHFEPYESSYRIRMRLNGLLVTTHTLSHNVNRRIASHIKVLANLNIAERRLPQDGRIKLEPESGAELDLRVSVLPTRWGEKIVIRLLHTTQQALDLDQLGFTPSQKELFRQSIHRPQGMILITGPTGSGKTVTLYSALNELNTEDKNISTVEDPAEISLAGINQIQTNEKIGLSFSQVLRAMLRQDPDIIMIGEIRDKETATIALRAAQTGHLVFSTLHTNSARATFIRLQQMGFESYQLLSAIRLIVAQRLVRQLCPHCKHPVTESNPLIHQFNIHKVIFRANQRGCHACTGGYQGRIAIYEMLSGNDLSTDSFPKITDTYIPHNAPQTLWQNGILKLEQGLTSTEELYRVLGSPVSEKEA